MLEVVNTSSDRCAQAIDKPYNCWTLRCYHRVVGGVESEDLEESKDLEESEDSEESEDLEDLDLV